jgi:hypothetical protein
MAAREVIDLDSCPEKQPTIKMDRSQAIDLCGSSSGDDEADENFLRSKRRSEARKTKLKIMIAYAKQVILFSCL